MRNKKDYKTPAAQVTEFECADVITVSEARNLYEKPNNTGSTTYVYGGKIQWNDGFKGN